MSAAVLLLDQTRFTKADERLMRAVARRLAGCGFAVEREIGRKDDRYHVVSCFAGCAPWAPAGAIVPAWTILRRANGRYQLQDGFGDVLAASRRLAEILPAAWLPLQLVPTDREEA